LAARLLNKDQNNEQFRALDEGYLKAAFGDSYKYVESIAQKQKLQHSDKPEILTTAQTTVETLKGDLLGAKGDQVRLGETIKNLFENKTTQNPRAVLWDAIQQIKDGGNSEAAKEVVVALLRRDLQNGDKTGHGWDDAKTRTVWMQNGNDIVRDANVKALLTSDQKQLTRMIDTLFASYPETARETVWSAVRHAHDLKTSEGDVRAEDLAGTLVFLDGRAERDGSKLTDNVGAADNRDKLVAVFGKEKADQIQAIAAYSVAETPEELKTAAVGVLEKGDRTKIADYAAFLTAQLGADTYREVAKEAIDKLKAVAPPDNAIADRLNAIVATVKLPETAATRVADKREETPEQRLIAAFQNNPSKARSSTYADPNGTNLDVELVKLRGNRYMINIFRDGKVDCKGIINLNGDNPQLEHQINQGGRMRGQVADFHGGNWNGEHSEGHPRSARTQTQRPVHRHQERSYDVGAPAQERRQRRHGRHSSAELGPEAHFPTPDFTGQQRSWTMSPTGYDKGQGGPNDPRGNRLYSIEDVLHRGAPYVSAAMDQYARVPYGQLAFSPELDKHFENELKKAGLDHLPIRIVDNGPAFVGKGHRRIDLHTEEHSDPVVNDPSKSRLTIVFVNESNRGPIGEARQESRTSKPRKDDFVSRQSTLTDGDSASRIAGRIVGPGTPVEVVQKITTELAAVLEKGVKAVGEPIVQGIRELEHLGKDVISAVEAGAAYEHALFLALQRRPDATEPALQDYANVPYYRHHLMPHERIAAAVQNPEEFMERFYKNTVQAAINHGNVSGGQCAQGVREGASATNPENGPKHFHLDGIPGTDFRTAVQLGKVFENAGWVRIPLNTLSAEARENLPTALIVRPWSRDPEHGAGHIEVVHQGDKKAASDFQHTFSYTDSNYSGTYALLPKNHPFAIEYLNRPRTQPIEVAREEGPATLNATGRLTDFRLESVTDSRVLAQVKDAVLLPFFGRATVMNKEGQGSHGRSWHYEDQQYWLERGAAQHLLSALQEIKDSLGMDLTLTDRNAAGRTASMQQAIVARSVTGSNRGSNHLYGRSVDFFPGGRQRLSAQVRAILAKHHWTEGDRSHPFSFGDWGHYTYHG
jgi:hypothetical protein